MLVNANWVKSFLVFVFIIISKEGLFSGNEFSSHTNAFDEWKRLWKIMKKMCDFGVRIDENEIWFVRFHGRPFVSLKSKLLIMSKWRMTKGEWQMGWEIEELWLTSNWEWRENYAFFFSCNIAINASKAILGIHEIMRHHSIAKYAEVTNLLLSDCRSIGSFSLSILLNLVLLLQWFELYTNAARQTVFALWLNLLTPKASRINFEFHMKRTSFVTST